MQYKIFGDTLPVLECTLQKDELIKCEAGAMIYRSEHFDMATKAGGLKGMFSRAFGGEDLFSNQYVSKKDGAYIAFASSVPGSIKAVEIQPNQALIIEKSSFLAGTRHVERQLHLKQKLRVSLFGGEELVMQKIVGQGVAFLEFDGMVIEKDLAQDEVLLVDTGHVVAFQESVDLSIERVKGVKNMTLGGEGMFLSRLTGPGKVWIQSMPLERLAEVIADVIDYQQPTTT